MAAVNSQDLGYPALLSHVPVVISTPPQFTMAAVKDQSAQSTDIPIDYLNGMQVAFLPAYTWAPGYTQKGIASHTDYVESAMEESARIRKVFADNVGKVTRDMNKLMKDEKGLAEVMTNFRSWVGRMSGAYKKVGFVGRDDMYAQVHLTMNLMSRRYKENCDKIINKQRNYQHLLRFFLAEEPFNTQMEALVEATLTLRDSTSEAEMGSFLTDVQNGERDIPSFIIAYSALRTGKCVKALNRLAKECKNADLQIYELRIHFDIPVKEGVEEVWKKLEEFCSSLGNIDVELLSVLGTRMVEDDEHSGHEKLASRILKALASGKGSKGLMRLNISDCYVDRNLFASVEAIVAKSSVTSVKLSKLIPGLKPRQRSTVLEVKMQPVGCGLGCKLCLAGEVCMCCQEMPDYPATIKALNDNIRSFNEENSDLHSDCVAPLIGIYKGLAKNGSVDIIDMSGTNLAALCKTATGVRDVLTAVAKSKPTAIILSQTGLTGAHTAALCHLFFNNEKMAHLDLSISPCEDVEAMENIQNLVQNTPFLATGSLTYDAPVPVTVHDPYESTESEGGDCCFSWKKVAHSQQKHVFTVPQECMSQEDFNSHFSTMYDGSTEKRLAIPWYYVLGQRWKGNEKKLKNLLRVSKDKQYAHILSPEADEDKKALLEKFIEEVMQTNGEDAMAMFECESEELFDAEGAAQAIKADQDACANAIQDGTVETQLALKDEQ
jgi:hypothetical protein